MTPSLDLNGKFLILYFQIGINNKMNKILVTGGSGFIGTNFLKSIKGEFSEIRSNYHSNSNFFKVDGVQYIKANLEEVEECKNL